MRDEAHDAQIDALAAELMREPCTAADLAHLGGDLQAHLEQLRQELEGSPWHLRSRWVGPRARHVRQYRLVRK